MAKPLRILFEEAYSHVINRAKVKVIRRTVMKV